VLYYYDQFIQSYVVLQSMTRGNRNVVTESYTTSVKVLPIINVVGHPCTIYICHIKKLHYFTYDIWKTIILILIDMVGMCFIITLRKLQIFLYRYEGPDSIISQLIYTIIEVSFKAGLTVCGRYGQRFE
jgi:hypothetical protein